MRQERLAELLGDVVRRIQIPEELADRIAEQLRSGQTDLEDARKESLAQLTQQRRVVQSKLDRGYEDYLASKISAEFWERKSKSWEDELSTINIELERVSRPTEGYAVTGARILELAKRAHFLYVSQDSTEQRKLLQTVLSNCTFDRGSLCAAYTKPFDVLAKGAETGNWRREWAAFARTLRRPHSEPIPPKLAPRKR